MFDKKAPAEAMILEDEGSGNVMDTDMHGVDWDHHKYILEVRPQGEQPFRVETKAKVPIFSPPRPGDVVWVLYDPKNHKAEIMIEGDPRYDPKLIRENQKHDREARAAALLGGAPVTVNVVNSVNIVPRRASGPPWIVPANCAECGAQVDEAKASMAEHPTCQYCSHALPCKPAQ
jgi:hypothetical protein